jgi:hypothetical protein
MTSRERLDLAIDALARLYENGHLLASTAPSELLMMAVEEIRASRETTPKVKP